MQTFDYVIVGAGSAGCVLANRLSANPAVRVLLLEAGRPDWHPYIQVPIGIGMLWKHRMYDWGYDSDPEEGLGRRRLLHLRGKVLGGSSSVNVMAFTRGHPDDYNRWARNGAVGWSWDNVLPYFKRIETWEGGASTWRGGAGPVGVQFARTTDPLFDALLAAGQSAGFPTTDDYNGANAVGFGRSQYTIRYGRRSSASQAYLRPVRSRPNLLVETRAHVQRVVLSGTRARGVEYTRRGALVRADAEKEVIICGGAFNTPQLLMLSGIGPAEHLRTFGITPILDAPVGNNLQDHLCVQLLWKRRSPGIFHHDMRFDRASIHMAQAYLFGRGPATIVPGGLHAFLKTRSDIAVPDIEFMFRAAPPDAGLWFPVLKRPYDDGYYMGAAILHPESRGEVRLTSADPTAPVSINNRFLSAQSDLDALRGGFKLARDTGNQPALEAFRGTELAPGEGVQTDAEIDAWIRTNARTVSHPAGTCRMGNDRDAVLDPELRVRGIEALRVVDASAMPDLVSAHINACVLMIAERAADLILNAGGTKQGR